MDLTWLEDFVAQGGKVVIAGSDTTELGDSPNIVRLPANPGKAYNDEQEKDFDHASPDSQKEFFAALAGGDSVKIEASTHVATSIARTADGHINCYFANFAGLVGGSNPIQTPQEGVQVTLKSKSEGKASFLPFMGEAQPVKGERHGDSVTFTLPTITRGAVFSFEP